MGNEPGLSYWAKTSSRKGETTFKGERRCDVAIVGGGLTGITTAYLLSRQGVTGVLLEADRIGSGTTGGTTGKITFQHGLKYHSLIASMGREKAAAYHRANSLGLELTAGLVDELRLACDFERCPAHVYTRDAGRLRLFDDEARACEDLGIPFSMTESCGLPFSVERVLTVEHQGRFHPLKYLFGLADAIAPDAFTLHERSRVMEIIPGQPCTLRTQDGALTADTVVLATNYPVLDMPGFYFARLHRERSYLLSVEAGDLDIGGMYITDADPVHSMRMQRGKDGNRLLAGGFGHKTGRGGSTMGNYEALYDFTHMAFDALPAEPDSAWSAQDSMPMDHVPYIGLLSDSAPRIFVASGYGKWGMAASAAAALLLTSRITGDHHPILEAEALFSPSRFTPTASAREFVIQGANVAKSYLGGNMAILDGSPDDIEPGQGALMRVDGDGLAVSRSPSGRLTACRPHCTHMGCPVVWNDAEQSWDCPCHGSRFRPEGDVLEGPATLPLPQVDLGPETR